MAPRKLGKTATALLARLQKSPHKTIGVDWGVDHRTPFGKREQRAASELAKAGLVTIKSDGAYYNAHRGKVTVTYSWTLKLVE